MVLGFAFSVGFKLKTEKICEDKGGNGYVDGSEEGEEEKEEEEVEGEESMKIIMLMTIKKKKTKKITR